MMKADINAVDLRYPTASFLLKRECQRAGPFREQKGAGWLRTQINLLKSTALKLILSIVIIFLVACGTKPNTLDQQILGRWSMANVYEYGLDVTDRHNPNQDRWIEFKPDGSFVSDGTPFGRNTGRWKADNALSILYIDSDVDNDDSEWKVTFESDQLIWTGIGHPRKENTRLIHTRRK